MAESIEEFHTKEAMQSDRMEDIEGVSATR